MTRAPVDRRRMLVALATQARRRLAATFGSAARRCAHLVPMLALAACGSDDTVLALNVESSDDVGFVSELQVTVTQPGNAPVNKRFTPPTKALDDDAGTVIQPRFFERIALPASWDEESATVVVRALSPTAPEIEAMTTAKIEPGGAVAAYVELARAKPDAGAQAGDGGLPSDAGPSDAAASDAGASDGGPGDGGARDGAAGDAGS